MTRGTSTGSTALETTKPRIPPGNSTRRDPPLDSMIRTSTPECTGFLRIGFLKIDRPSFATVARTSV